MKKLTFLDVEYANSKNKSICQIGIKYLNRDTDEVKDLSLLVNPRDGFDPNCTRIHSITDKIVEKSPDFREAWDEIKEYFEEGNIIIGHNVASADLDALCKNLDRYNIPIPSFYYVDTLDLAKLVVPYNKVADYRLSTLCDYFGIMEQRAHNAFSDASACFNLFQVLAASYHFDMSKLVKKYDHATHASFESFASNVELRKAISDLYGRTKGFGFDQQVTKEEDQYLSNWVSKHLEQGRNHEEIAQIINVILSIRKDGVVTPEELRRLENTTERYLDKVNTANSTLATQILNGILAGITEDRVVNKLECQKLLEWLYENQSLTETYPFNQIFEAVERIVKNSVFTKEDEDLIKEKIKEMLNPVESLRSEIYSVKDKTICLSGNFEYGQKSDVEKLIEEHGGIIVPSVAKKTQILVIGNSECQAYANGTYGTKVVKAMNLQAKGIDIKIIKESDLMSALK